MIQAQAAEKAKAPLTPFSYDEKIEPHDVVVKITHCGICHSDVHLVDGDWGEVFPCVPGHEIIGTVDQVGESVTEHKVGDKVGVGWQCNSCGTCEHCDNHEETFCDKQLPTCMGHFGGFADKVVSNDRFVIPIPTSMDSAKTAPLLCGGITVYNPLKTYAKPGDSVAIIGIGGLGHLGIQFAKAMGCKVTALSTNPEKETQAKAFGATEFSTELPKPNSFDVILNTAHFSPDMQVYMASLKAKGTFVQLGAAPDNLSVHAFSLIDGNKKLTGSGVGHPDMIKEMIALANEKNIYAQVEVMPMSKANEALDITRSNKARFRVVLENK